MTKGFTLIELIMVIVVLGILSALALPRFADFSSQAHSSVVAGTGGALRAGVQGIHQRWVVAGSPGAILNFALISNPSALGDLSVNSNGWPADTRGSSLTMNSDNDCLDVWRAVLEQGAPSVSLTTGSDYLATYVSNACTYIYQSDTALNITYDSLTGLVVINN